MNYYLFQSIELFFWLHLITGFLGTIFYTIIERIRKIYKQHLPTPFHCILLKISILFFFFPNTIIIYLLTSFYHINFFPLHNKHTWILNFPLFPLQFLCITIWLAGFMQTAKKYITMYLQLNNYTLSCSYQTSDPALLDLSRHLSKHYHFKKALPIYIHSYIPTPSLIGLLKPKIVLPESIVQTADQSTLQIILSHEFMHNKKKDIFWFHFSILVSCCYWYHPAIYKLKSSLKEWLEYECDEQCCQRNQNYFSAQMYFNTILILGQKKDIKSPYIFGINFYENEFQIENRIIHMHNKKKVIEKDKNFCFRLLFIILFSYFTFLTCSFSYLLL